MGEFKKGGKYLLKGPYLRDDVSFGEIIGIFPEIQEMAVKIHYKNGEISRHIMAHLNGHVIGSHTSITTKEYEG